MKSSPTKAWLTARDIFFPDSINPLFVIGTITFFLIKSRNQLALELDIEQSVLLAIAGTAALIWLISLPLKSKVTPQKSFHTMLISYGILSLISLLSTIHIFSLPNSTGVALLIGSIYLLVNTLRLALIKVMFETHDYRLLEKYSTHERNKSFSSRLLVSLLTPSLYFIYPLGGISDVSTLYEHFFIIFLLAIGKLVLW